VGNRGVRNGLEEFPRMLDVITVFGLVAVVLTVSGLTSGLVERAPLSFPIIFLGLGFVLGGAGVIEVGPHSEALEAVAFLVLALVLFLDAVRLEAGSVRAAGLIPMLSLGPGTVIIILIVAAAGYLLLGLSVVEALLVGTILASTDPVVLRDVVRNERIPRSVRQALSIEAGTNDIVVLPVLLVLIAVANAQSGSTADWLLFVGQVFLLGPLIGFCVGAAGAWLMSKADAAFDIRREHKALYGIGLVLLAFTAAQLPGGDGFLAAFAAGLAVAVLNLELCDCFLDYGETTAEAAMLLAFILFGAVIYEIAWQVPMGKALLLAVVVLLVARPLAITLVLRHAAISPQARAFIAWFGPRGLSSLLLALLVVEGGVPNAVYLLAVVGIVVTVSVIAHGTTATPIAALYAQAVERHTLAEERRSSAAGLFRSNTAEVARITPDELADRLRDEHPPLVLDVRTRSQYRQDNSRIPRGVRVLPDQVQDWATHWLAAHPRVSHPPVAVTYCTCPDEATSLKAAESLRAAGFRAVALLGGFEAWKAKHSVEPVNVTRYGIDESATNW
jgi:NhaP-type Na+/H+ or K+/H+ antiporter